MLSPAEKLLQSVYPKSASPDMSQKIAKVNLQPVIDILRRVVQKPPQPAPNTWTFSPKRIAITTGVLGTGALGTGGAGYNYFTSLDRAEEEPLDFSDKEEAEDQAASTAAYAATGGLGTGLVSVLYGKLADKPDLQRDLISTLSGAAVGAAVGMSNQENA